MYGFQPTKKNFNIARKQLADVGGDFITFSLGL